MTPLLPAAFTVCKLQGWSCWESQAPVPPGVLGTRSSHSTLSCFTTPGALLQVLCREQGWEHNSAGCSGQTNLLCPACATLCLQKASAGPCAIARNAVEEHIQLLCSESLHSTQVLCSVLAQSRWVCWPGHPAVWLDQQHYYAVVYD